MQIPSSVLLGALSAILLCTTVAHAEEVAPTQPATSDMDTVECDERLYEIVDRLMKHNINACTDVLFTFTCGRSNGIGAGGIYNKLSTRLYKPEMCGTAELPSPGS